MSQVSPMDGLFSIVQLLLTTAQTVRKNSICRASTKPRRCSWSEAVGKKSQLCSNNAFGIRMSILEVQKFLDSCSWLEAQIKSISDLIQKAP